jgi:hypothetical protein
MTTKDAFTTDEWQTLRRGIYDAGRYLVLADPTSPADLAKGARAIAGFFSDLRDQAARLGEGSPLLQALLADPAGVADDDTLDTLPNLASPEMTALRQKTLDGVRQAGALLDAKATPDEARGLKIKMYQLAGQTAAASKQGSFFGIGGVRVTDTEKAALADVAAALNINPADATESWPLPGQA